ncbi:hypothetical protein HMPREF0534_0139 [Limosilactobacillus reuteri CF48-3A]|uniref:Uncharacterized protein n=1 Tax=Limosilactobacillus reuteri CF48-3A TaxID=525341 RepID=A0A8D9VVI7_LIMRT|nr:hypothetical protein HMPREF0534_0139 [Limosilactobacillus reuteri CF48-3A]
MIYFWSIIKDLGKAKVIFVADGGIIPLAMVQFIEYIFYIQQL